MRPRHPAPAESEQTAEKHEHNEGDVDEDDEIGKNCHTGIVKFRHQLEVYDEAGSHALGVEVKHALSSWGPGRESRVMTSQPPSFNGYRFPPEIISHAVWLVITLLCQHPLGSSARSGVSLCTPGTDWVY